MLLLFFIIGLIVVNLHNIRMALRLLDLLMEHLY